MAINIALKSLNVCLSVQANQNTVLAKSMKFQYSDARVR